MSNVVCMTTRKKEEMTKGTQGVLDAFIYEFYDWANAHGVDTTTEEFRWEAATVLTIVQGMLQKKDS